MPIQLLSIGPVQTMVQNVVYAVPARHCDIYTAGAAAAIEESTDPTFAIKTSLNLNAGQTELDAPFIRCATHTIDVTLRAKA